MSADQPRRIPSGLAVDDGLQFHSRLKTLPPSGAADSGVHPHPPPLTLAYMAWLAYKEDPWEELKKLQETGHLADWMVLITAKHKGLTNGYHGVAFFHTKARQLVFSHRGTKLNEIGSIWTDISGVYFNKVAPQLLSAMTFVHQVLCMITGRVESIFITGHSLGGWLSGATTYSAQYLTVLDKNFFYRQYPQWKPHTTTFESPGASNVILKLKRKCQPAQEHFSMEQLDITDYVSSPNFINTANSHEGARLLRVFNQQSSGLLTTVTNLGRNLKSEHSMQSMMDSFVMQTGLPKHTFQEIWDWPCSISQTNEVDASSDPYSQTVPQSSGETSANVRLQVRVGKMTERQLACFTPGEENFLKLYVALPQDLKQIPLPIIDSPELRDILNKISYLASRKFECPTPSDVLLFVPTVRRLIRHHPLYVYELMTQKNLNKYLAQYLDVKFEAMPLTDGCVIHVETPDDLVLTAKQVLHTLQLQQPQRQPIVLTHEDLVTVRNDSMLTALRGKAERFVFILIHDVNIAIQIYRDQLKMLEKAGIKTVVVTKPIEECLGDMKVTAGRVNWTDLTADGRVGLVDHKGVRFQGSSELVSLKDMFPSLQVNDPDALNEMVSPEVLARLLSKTTGTPVDVGRKLPVVPNYYVPRSFQLLKVDRRIFVWDDCCFAITGISSDGFQSLSISVSSSSEFKFLPKFTQMLETKRTTLYLRHEEGIFYLWHYHGDATRILKELDKLMPLGDCHGVNTRALKKRDQKEEKIKIIQSAEDSFQFQEYDLRDIGMPAVCIVGAEPGLGKSTTLKNMAKGLKQDSPMSWVIHVDLHDHTELFERHTRQKQGVFRTKESVINFVVNDWLKCECNEQFGVRESLEKGECRLVVDSFDEIAPRYNDFVLRLLTALKDFGVCRHLVVATRNHLLSDLQKKLGGCSMTVAKFTEKQKEQFIAGKCRDGGLSEERVKALLRRLPALERLSDLSCNPLQLAMLTDVLAAAESCDWTKLGDLYRGFVDKKEDIWKEKEGWKADATGVHANIVQNVASFHMSHALQSLFPEPKIGTPPINEKMNELAVKMGIVEQRGDTIRFIHQTFAEYFVAEYILTVLQRPTIAEDQQDLLLNEILVKEEHFMIRVFLNDLLAGHENVPNAKEVKLERRVNGNGQWVLHVVADENHVQLGRYLQKYFRENHKSDWTQELLRGDGNGNTPVHCAAKRGAFKLLNAWHSRNINVCLGIQNKEEMTPVELTAMTLVSDVAERRARETWLDLIQDTIDWKTKGRNGYTAVHWAADKGNFTALVQLFYTVPQSRLCLVVCSEKGKMPVHLAVAKFVSDDAERSARGTWLGLIQDSFDWTTKDSDGYTAVHWAAEKGNFTALVQLFNIVPQSRLCLVVCSEKGKMPVHLAVTKFVSDVTERSARGTWLGLIQDSFDWTTKDSDGYTAVHWAAEKGNFTALVQLFNIVPQSRQCLIMCNEWGEMPVHLAMAKWVFDEAERFARGNWLDLIKDTIDWTAKGRTGYTVVHWAADRGNFTGMVQLYNTVPQSRQCLSKCDQNGNMPLHLAMKALVTDAERSARKTWLALICDSMG